MREPIIEIKGLTKYFGYKAPLYEVSLTIERGDIFALLGKNGAGKSTLIKILLGMLEPTRGNATLLQCDCQQLTPEIRAKIGYLAEGHHLYDWMRIRDIENFKKAHPNWVQSKFEQFVQYFQFDKKQKIRFLSLGQRAQLSLALTLACEPELLIMDDPTLGLDTEIRREFLKGILDLVSLEKRTVLLTSHIMSDVERVADRVGILEDGVLRANLPLEDFKTNVCQYHVTFNGEIPSHWTVPRLVQARTSGKDILCTVVRPAQDIEDAFQAMGASAWKRIELSFEDAFVEYTSRQKKNLSWVS